MTTSRKVAHEKVAREKVARERKRLMCGGVRPAIDNHEDGAPKTLRRPRD